MFTYYGTVGGDMHLSSKVCTLASMPKPNEEEEEHFLFQIHYKRSQSLVEYYKVVLYPFMHKKNLLNVE